MTKYRNKKCEYDGFKFDSVKERDRYIELRFLEHAGKISGLEVHPRFELIPKQPGEQAAYYTADFAYWDNDFKAKTKTRIVEDVKSPATAKAKDYILRRKLFRQRYPEIEFREV